MSSRVCLVGATGAVGTEFLRIIERYKPKFKSLELLASSRSAGTKISILDEKYVVKDIDSYDFSNVDIAFFSAGSSVSQKYAPKASKSGCIVIDNTSFFRMDADKKLVVPCINGSTLNKIHEGEIIANPNCSTIQIVKVLDVVKKEFGIEYSVASTYQAASGAGKAAVVELLSHGDKSNLSKDDSQYFSAPLAFNVVPRIDQMFENGWTKEELKVTHESRKILGDPELSITTTAVRVPVVSGHSVALYIKAELEINIANLLKVMRANHELVVAESHDDIFTPRFIGDKSKTYVGRVRLDPDNNRGLWLWVVADNLWVGAAYNGYQIAETLGAFN